MLEWEGRRGRRRPARTASTARSEIDPSILGTLFERVHDPGKRAQLGAHYTDREKIMLLVEPVVTRPLLAEWNRERAEIAAGLGTRGSRPVARRNDAERRYRAFLTRLREFTVLDLAHLVVALGCAGPARRRGC